MAKQQDLPEVVEKSEEEIALILQTIQDSNLPDNIKSFIIKCIELSIWFPRILQKKNTSLRRLRALIFGSNNNRKHRRKQSTSTNNSNPPDKPEDDIGQNQDDKTDIPENAAANKPDEQNQETTNALVEQQKPKGHGRMPHTVYENCVEITIELDYQVGDPCPTLCGGKLRYYSPGILIRVTGDNIAHVTRYTVMKLRCNLCDIIIKPTLPDNIGEDKYDASFKAMLALQKYYVAVPFYRQEYFQAILGFPLSDATQWDLIEQLAGSCYPVFNILKTLAANGELVHNDDTKVRILEVIKRNQKSAQGDAKGMFTTGIISIYEGRKIALFLNGTKHAGNNLQDVLKNRAKEKGEIIQMCDGSSQNIPGELATIICNCLSHAFRKFDEIAEDFPEECIHIMKLLGKVYDNDKQTQHLTKEERLTYHQQHSKPIMDLLKKYIDTLLSAHRVEPNSDLGAAIQYMQKRWGKLTRFLTVAGAPLDNNIVERALKIAIRNRKAALFYKTEYSAQIGGMITSLIYTCVLSNINPFHYLTVLQQYQQHVNKSPNLWLPWSYQETLALNSRPPSQVMKGDANRQVTQQSVDYPVAA